MGAMKNYFLALLEATTVTDSGSPNGFAQEAIEWAAQQGLIKVTGDIDLDTFNIYQQYDVILESYRRTIMPEAFEEADRKEEVA
jgi:hypothetical protein